MPDASRHAGIVAALRDPRFEAGLGGRQLHESARALRLPDDWAQRWATRFAALPERIDLIAGLAAPMCLMLAADVTGLSIDEAERLAPVARRLFDPEADPDGAAVELMRPFGDALHVQAFAALSHTFTAFLGNAWLALLEHPAEMARLGSTPALLPDAVEELLRFAGPSAVVFRRDVDGTRVALRLADANRDPAAFPDPNRLDLSRRPTGHLAFGAGPHACAGAALIRAAARAPIAQFASRFAGRAVIFHAEAEVEGTLRSLRNLTIKG